MSTLAAMGRSLQQEQPVTWAFHMADTMLIRDVKLPKQSLASSWIACDIQTSEQDKHEGFK